MNLRFKLLKAARKALRHAVEDCYDEHGIVETPSNYLLTLRNLPHSADRKKHASYYLVKFGL